MRVKLRGRLAALAVLPAAALALASCSGGDEEDVGDLLDKAFRKPITSADLKVDATIKARGLESFDEPVRIQASGPYRERKGKLPDFDIDVKVRTGDGGQVVSTGRVLSGDRAFVKFEDTYYELPREEVAAAKRRLAGNPKQRSALRDISLARSWLRDAKDEGDEDIAGVETTHVSGRLEVARALPDINRLVREAGGTLGAAGEVPKPLSRSQLERIERMVDDPTFDVYVGKDDHTIRRLSARIELTVPKEDQASLEGLEGGVIEFSIEFRNIGGRQRIEPPARARPLSDLTKSLDAGALRGGRRGSASPGVGDGPPAPQSGGGRDTSGSDAEAFERYSECLDKAKPPDTDALQRCADVLR